MTHDRPTGRLRPPSEALRDVLDAIDAADVDRAQTLLDDTDAPKLWRYYLEGRLALARDNVDKAESSFLELKKMVADAACLPEPEHLRLAALALKKLGAIERKREAYLRAIGYHATEYGYLNRAGSFEDLHDAAVSLDVDHFFAGDAAGSLCWGERSLEFARQVESDRARHRCEGMSLNNLAMWHADMGDSARGVEFAEASLASWMAYEDLAGREENRVVWAEYGVGYALSQRANNLEAAEASNAIELARERYQRALDLAEKRRMSAESVEPIVEAKNALD